MKGYRVGIGYVLLIALLVVMQMPHAVAQSRLSDNDVQGLMNNLYEDAKSFQGSFKNAVKKTSIRKTSREKEANNLVARFVTQAETMRNDVRNHKKADSDVQAVMSSGDQINQLVSTLQLDATTTSKWAKVQNELNQLGTAYNIPVAGGRAVDNPDSCQAAVGADRANELVQQCLQVSPATHPPCNVQNPCSLIKDEIKRGCGMLTGNAPKFCGEYK